MSRYLPCLMLLFCHTALARDPWINPTLEVDRESEIAVLSELVELSEKFLAVKRRMIEQGELGGGFHSYLAAAQQYFRAESRLKWAEGDFAASHQFAQFVVLMHKQSVAAAKEQFEVGQATADLILARQLELSEARLVLLRFEAVAKQRGIEMEPATQAELDEYIKQKFGEGHKAPGGKATSRAQSLFGDADSLESPEIDSPGIFD